MLVWILTLLRVSTSIVVHRNLQDKSKEEFIKSKEEFIKYKEEIIGQVACSTFASFRSCPSTHGCYWDGQSCQAVFFSVNETYYINLPLTDNWAENIPLNGFPITTTWTKLRIVGIPQMGDTSILVDLLDSTFSNSSCQPFFGMSPPEPCSTPPTAWGRAFQCQYIYMPPAKMRINLVGTPFAYVPSEHLVFGHMPREAGVVCAEDQQVCEAAALGYCAHAGLELPHARLAIINVHAYIDAVKARVKGSCAVNEYLLKQTCVPCDEEIEVLSSKLSTFCTFNGSDRCIGNLATLKARSRSCDPSNPFGGISGSYKSMPAFVDWDRDGYLDLLLGSINGNLRYFEQDQHNNVKEVDSDSNPFSSINQIANQTCHSLPYWHDSDGYNCSEYVRHGWCANGTYGPVWNPVYWGTFDYYSLKDFQWLHAGQACCECGKPSGFGHFAAPALVDWDGDNNLDLFVGSQFGPLWYFKSNAFHTWEDHTALGDHPFAMLGVRKYITPAFTDWDGDGDLDVVVGSDDGTLQYFQQTSSGALVEMDGLSNPFVGCRVERRSAPAFADWDGDFDLDLILGSKDGMIHYYERVSKNLVTERVGYLSQLTTEMFSSPAVIDWDRDGDLDLVAGQMIGLQYYEHVAVNRFVEQSSVASDPFIEVSRKSQTRMHPVVVDWNGDGTDGLLVGWEFPDEEWSLLNHFSRVSGESLKVYRDFSFPAIFIEQGNKYQGTPAPVDWDSDGDLDLLFCHETESVDCGVFRYFENVFGNLTERFKDENPFSGICARIVKPAFIDWDNDGDVDFVFGGQRRSPDGTQDEWIIRYFERDASGNLTERTGSKSNPFFAIKLEVPSPAFVDWDGDGDQDLVVGTKAGFMHYFKRISVNILKEQTGESNPFFEIDVGTYAVPALADWDKDGDIDLITGDGSGRVRFFANGFCTQSEPCSLNGICSVLRNQCDCIFSHTHVDCSMCNSGYHAGTNIYPLECLECPAGFFSSADSATCTDCPAGHVSAKASGSCTACAAGRFPNEVGDDCDFCAPGTYSTRGSVNCSYCAGGKVPNGLQTGCDVCDAGKHAQQGDLRCELCEPGTSSSGVGNTSGVGMRTKVDSEIQFEVNGNTSGVGTSHCTTCQEGTYAPRGSETCTQCPVGHFAASGASECIACPSDSYSAAGSSQCKFCDDGKRPSADQSRCQLDIHFAILIVACIFGQNLVTYPIFRYAFQRVLVTDVSQMGNMVVITTRSRHGCNKKYGIHKSKIHVWHTGHPELDGKFWHTVRPIDSLRLELLDEHGTSITDEIHTSMGVLVQHPVMSVILEGPTYPYLMICGLLLPAVWMLLMLRDEIHNALHFVLAIGATTICTFLYAMYRRRSQRLRRKTPMGTRLKQFKQKLSESNPNPNPCEPGPGRAVQLGDIRDLLHFFRDFIKSRNAYYLASNVILPVTKSHQLSFAEIVGPARIRYFVSHYWGTSFEHFVTTLEHHALVLHERTLTHPSNLTLNVTPDTPAGRKGYKGDDAVAYWICFLSNNQWHLSEEVCDWQNSSFYKALHSETCHGTCMVLDGEALPLTRAWCLFEVLQTFRRVQDDRFEGISFCTDRGVIGRAETQINNETCYDVALALSLRLLKMDLARASASSVEDLKMIRELIEREGGFEKMNEFIRSNMSRAIEHVQRGFQEQMSQIIGQLSRKTSENNEFATPREIFETSEIVEKRDIAETFSFRIGEKGDIAEQSGIGEKSDIGENSVIEEMRNTGEKSEIGEKRETGEKTDISKSIVIGKKFQL